MNSWSCIELEEIPLPASGREADRPVGSVPGENYGVPEKMYRAKEVRIDEPHLKLAEECLSKRLRVGTRLTIGDLDAIKEIRIGIVM